MWSISKKGRKEPDQKWTRSRKELDQKCETKFLQMCSFSISLTSLQSLSLSFSVLFFVISTAIPKFQFWFPASLPWFPAFLSFSYRYPAFPRWFHAFPFHSLYPHPYSLHSSHSVPQFPISAFTDNLLSL